MHEPKWQIIHTVYLACFDSWMESTMVKLSEASMVLLWESEPALHGRQWKPNCVWVNHIYNLIVTDESTFLSFSPLCGDTFFCLIAFISKDLRWYSQRSYSSGTHRGLLGLRRKERKRERGRERERAWMIVRERARERGQFPLGIHTLFPLSRWGILIKTLPGLSWKDMVIIENTHTHTHRARKADQAPG